MKWDYKKADTNPLSKMQRRFIPKIIKEYTLGAIIRDKGTALICSTMEREDTELPK